MGRTAHGVRGMKLRRDDRVVGLVVTNENASLLTICQFGFGKRTPVTEYRKTKRGGQGVINIKTTERNGNVVAMMSVVDTDELMVVTAQGIALRTDLSELRDIGRATQGVRLIRINEGDEVVAVAKIVPDEAENAKEASGSGAPSSRVSTEEDGEADAELTDGALPDDEVPDADTGDDAADGDQEDTGDEPAGEDSPPA